jgi:nicotinate phosphoribosyltransferase
MRWRAGWSRWWSGCDFRIDAHDTAYLATLQGNDGTPLFDAGFLAYLQAGGSGGGLRLSVDAVPEGTVVFPHEPLVRVRGPILQAQLVETALLCLINFYTLVCTKAARVCWSAQASSPPAQEVLEFGLRRAQGLDGALAASRAAYIGGCAATSNVLAGRRYGIPVRGTHAHSWVMSFGDELAAFREYARASPNNCVFLVDTYDTLLGVQHAIEVGRELVATGHRLAGIRLDSGDLSYLAHKAREMLDAAGFADTQIMASNDLDEHTIAAIKQQQGGANIAVWGVGTRLVTAYDQPALGGVYKLSATREARDGAPWQPCIKLSEQAIKVSTPGILNVRRFTAGGEFVGDVIWDELAPPPSAGPWTAVDPADSTRRKVFPERTRWHDLLVPIMRDGQLVWKPPPLADVREYARAQIAQLHPGIKRLVNPHEYVVGLEPLLLARRLELIIRERDTVRAAREKLLPPFPTTPSPPSSSSTPPPAATAATTTGTPPAAAAATTSTKRKHPEDESTPIAATRQKTTSTTTTTSKEEGTR